MKKYLALALLASTAIAQTPEPGSRDGEVRHLDDGFIAWDAAGETWRSPEGFWQAFSERERGKNWGSGSAFPRYEDVNEHDAFLLETDQGACLMYFFHRRWRRANDVWRWDPAFNEYAGCPYVFD